MSVPDVGLGSDQPLSVLRAVEEAADHLGLGIAVLDVTISPETVLYVSDAAARIFGRAREELEGNSPWIILDPSEIPAQERRLAERGRGVAPPQLFESMVRRPDGVRVPVEFAMTRVLEGRRALSVVFIRDITARRAAEETLRLSESRFRALVENAPDGVVILRDRKITFINELAVRLLGVPDRAAALGTDILALMPADEARRAGERIGRMIATGEALDPMEYRVGDADSDRFVEIKSILVESVDGPAVVAFARDVSARKRVEQELLRADRLAAVGMLSAAVAHEINNPLTYVQLCLQFLERSLVDASTPAQRQALLDHLANARHGVERVATIVRDLRTFARSHDDDRGPADVVAAVEHAIKLAENELRHRARLVRKFETVPLVTGGGSRLEQVFLNLLINAMHALPDGDPARDEVVVEIAPLGDAMVEIIVADTGVGVPGPLRDRVFEPFFTTKPIGEGTGLGLSVCRGIVESAGGSIALEGVEPHGTRVRVRLPVHQTTRAAPEPEVTVAAAEPGRRLRVLVVDDEPLVRRMLAVVLSRRHDVVLAENGRDALAEIQRGAEFDAIVCDLMMPELNGMELFEAVSTAIPALATRFVFITGGALGPRLAKFLDDVDAPTLYKPFQMQVVLDAVHAAAERGRG